MATGGNSALGIRIKTLFDSRSGLAELRTTLKELQKSEIIKFKVDFDNSKLNQIAASLKQIHQANNKQATQGNPYSQYEKGLNNLINNYKTLKITADQFKNSLEKMKDPNTGKNKMFDELPIKKQIEATNLLVKAEKEVTSTLTQTSNIRQTQTNKAIQEQKRITDEIKKTADLERDLASFKKTQATRVVGIEKRYGNIGNTSQELQKYMKDLNNVVVKNGQLVNSNTGVVTSFKQLSSGLTQVSATARNSVGFFDRLKDSFIKFSTYLFAGNLIVNAFRAFKTGMQSVVELDSSLTNINMTMRVTTSEMGELTSQSQKMASEMGISVKSVLDAAKVYANANEDIASILDKTKASIMLSTASGFGIEASTDAIQAIMNQFELSAEGSSMRIVDALQSISSSMAYDFGRGINQIAEGIQVSGSVAREAGFSMEQYSALLGSVVERTRLAGSQIANGMKTIFSRMGRAKTGEASEEEISQVESAYKSLGIALRDTSGQFRDIPDVIDELSAKWKNLDSVQKSYISELSAGIR